MRRFLWLFLITLLTGCALLPPEEIDTVPTLITPPESRTVTYVAEVGTIAEELRTLGRVAPKREETLYFTQSGRVRAVNVSFGTPVKEGDVLVELDVERLKREVELASIDLQKLDLRLERLEFEAQFSPASKFDLELLRLDRLKAQLQLDDMKRQIEEATLRAPFDGVITSLHVAEGDQVQEYASVLTIADPSELELHVELSSEDDFRRVTPGQRARLEIDRSRQGWATITQVPTYTQRNATGANRDRRVRLEIETPGLLAMNQTVTTVITLQEKTDAVIVPNAAIREFMGRTYVRVLEGDARREIDVEIGIRTPTHTEILRGIEPGTVVIGR